MDSCWLPGAHAAHTPSVLKVASQTEELGRARCRDQLLKAQEKGHPPLIKRCPSDKPGTKGQTGTMGTSRGSARPLAAGPEEMRAGPGAWKRPQRFTRVGVTVPSPPRKKTPTFLTSSEVGTPVPRWSQACVSEASHEPPHTQSLWVPVGRAPHPNQLGRALLPRGGCFEAGILWSESPRFLPLLHSDTDSSEGPSCQDTLGLLGSGDTLLLLLSWGQKPSHGEPPRGAGLQGVQAQRNHQGQQGQAGTMGASGSTQPAVLRSRFAPGRHQHSVDTRATWSLSEHPAPGRPGTNLAAGPVFSFRWSSLSFQASLKSEAAKRT